MHQSSQEWEAVGRNENASWYLDPVVAEQKREVNRALVERAAQGRRVEIVLKTDSFEEANGEDQILFDLFPSARLSLGMDLAAATVLRARRRCRAPRIGFLATDVRRIALADGSVDLVVSNSTLDHFDDPESFYSSLEELARVLKPGGAAMVALDNPWNPTYPPLRWISRFGWIPFRLGFTASVRKLERALEECGLRVVDTDTVIHNPRTISTVLFLVIRRVLGKRADGVIRGLLWLFSLADKLPTRWLTSCYIAVIAEKPGDRAGSD